MPVSSDDSTVVRRSSGTGPSPGPVRRCDIARRRGVLTTFGACPPLCSPCSTNPASSSSRSACSDLGWKLVSSGGTAAAIADAGIAGHRRGRADRRARRSSVIGSSRCIRRSTAASSPIPTLDRSSGRHGRVRHRADRSRRRQPVPVQREAGHRADRHRWAGDGPRGGEEPRARRRRRRSRRLRARARRDRAPRARSPTPPGDGWRATAFAHTAGVRRGDRHLVRRHRSRADDADAAAVLPPSIHLSLELAQPLRYGENPHQQGARYRQAGARAGGTAMTQHGGKELSYLNVFDTEAAWRLVQPFDEPACVIVKHANPCGVAVADGITEAYVRANACDPVSAFGGIVALNRTVPADLADRARRGVHRGDRRAGVRRRGARRSWPRRRTCACCRRQHRRRCRSTCVPSMVVSSCSSPTR